MKRSDSVVSYVKLTSYLLCFDFVKGEHEIVWAGREICLPVESELNMSKLH